MSNVITPERSLQQRRDALKAANFVRTERSKLKRDIGGGRVQIHDLILDPPEFILNMKLWDLMMAKPKLGRVKVNKILFQLRISPSKTVGGLSVRQRNEVVRLLRS